MPLLMCPNCNSSMQSVNRADVEFDMCPSCRGVWLDRGELEKIIAQAQVAAPPPAPGPGYASAPPPRDYDDRRPYDDRRDYRRDDDDDDYRRRGGYKKRSIFDIFD